MKRPLFAAAAAVVLATASGLACAASWSVIVQPGVYGRVAIGGYAEPPVVYAPQPVVAIDNGYGEVVEEYIDPAYATDQPPVYLWVPEYQRLHWAQYSREYGAYGVPVYFVDDGWYRANVMRRNWTPEQRSWSQQQWIEQDRMARDRVERQRFEQQRYEQQQRWNDQRAWRDQQQRQGDYPRDQRDPRGQGGQGDWDRGHDRDRGGQDAQNRIRWGSAQGFLPQQGQGGQGGQGGQSPRPQPGGAQWQQPGGQAPVGQQPGGQQPGGQWQQSGNGHGSQQPPAASQPRGGPGRDADRRDTDRRGDDRASDRGDRRGPGESRGGYEHGRDARRDR